MFPDNYEHTNLACSIGEVRGWDLAGVGGGGACALCGMRVMHTPPQLSGGDDARGSAHMMPRLPHLTSPRPLP